MQITSKLTMAVHMVCAIDYFGDSQQVTSTFLAKSVGTRPVMIRNIMGDLKRAGIISSSKGKSGISLARPLDKITLLDLWRAVDQTDADSLFRFHENPCPQCPVGGNIHAALDGHLADAQRALENQLAGITLEDVEADVRRRADGDGAADGGRGWRMPRPCAGKRCGLAAASAQDIRNREG